MLLVACLGDAVVEAALHGAAPGASAGPGSGTGSSVAWGMGSEGGDVDMADAEAAPWAVGDSSESVKQALQQLHRLAQRAKGGSTGTAGPSSLQAPQQEAKPPPPQQAMQAGSRMRVERSAEWVQDTAERLHQLLSTALPPLLAHQRPAVREALAQGKAPATCIAPPSLAACRVAACH